MEKREFLAVQLSQEELMITLATLKAKAIPGLNQKDFQDLTVYQVKSIAQAAYRAMIARGLIKLSEENKGSFEQEVLAIVGVCAFPEKSLLVTRISKYIPRVEFYFHKARKMFVLHTIPLRGIHQFLALENDLRFKQALLSNLELPDISASNVPEGELDSEFLALIQKFPIENKAAEFKKGLSKQKLNTATRLLFIRAIEQPTAITNFTTIIKTASGELINQCVVFEGNKTLWLIVPKGKKKDIYTLRSISSDDAVQVVKTIMEGK